MAENKDQRTTAAESKPPRNVHQAIVEVGRKMKGVGKDERNKEQNFQYRSIHALMNALQPIMASAGIFCHLAGYEIRTEETWKTAKGATGRRIVIDATYRWTSEDGSYIESRVPGEAFDYGDKGIGKALVYAQKNLILQTFMVPTADQEDPDQNAHEFREMERPQVRQPDRKEQGNGDGQTDAMRQQYARIESALKACKSPEERASVLIAEKGMLEAMPEAGRTKLEELAAWGDEAK